MSDLHNTIIDIVTNSARMAGADVPALDPKRKGGEVVDLPDPQDRALRAIGDLRLVHEHTQISAVIAALSPETSDHFTTPLLRRHHRLLCERNEVDLEVLLHERQRIRKELSRRKNSVLKEYGASDLARDWQDDFDGGDDAA